MIRFGKYNYSKGELHPEVIARVDVGSYQAGVKRARNVVIKKYGGLTLRPGTRMVSEVKDDTGGNDLIPFQYSIDLPYVLEMGQGYMRPLAKGGAVVEEDLSITAITQAAQAQVTAAFHDYEVGEDIYFTNIQGMEEINEMIGQVTSVVDVNNFKVNIDTTNFTAFTGTSSGIVRTSAPPAPPTPPTVPAVVPPPDLPDFTDLGGFEITYNPFGVLP